MLYFLACVACFPLSSDFMSAIVISFGTGTSNKVDTNAVEILDSGNMNVDADVRITLDEEGLQLCIPRVAVNCSY